MDMREIATALLDRLDRQRRGTDECVIFTEGPAIFLR